MLEPEGLEQIDTKESYLGSRMEQILTETGWTSNCEGRGSFFEMSSVNCRRWGSRVDDDVMIMLTSEAKQKISAG